MIGIYAKNFTVSQMQTSELSQAHRLSKNNKKHDLSKRKDRKATKPWSIVMLGFLICWFPWLFAILIDPFKIFSIPSPVFDSLISLGYLNSLCNPLIYGYFYPWFGKTFKYILKGKIFNLCFHKIKILSVDQSQ